MAANIRKARIQDAKYIHQLLGKYAAEGRLLPRSLSEIYDHLRDYFVAVSDSDEPMGVCSTHICWENLAEVRSLAVEKTHQGHGVGAILVEACISDAITLGIYEIFTLTYVPEFFKHFGFKEVDKSILPHKIWADCVKCVKFPECDEIAMLLKL